MDTVYKPIVKKISDLSIDEIDDLRSSELVIFCGSYISVYEPTNLPSGMLFCQNMFDYIFAKEFSQFTNLFKEFEKIPFEALMEMSPNQERALEVIFRLYSNNTYNSLHELLAKGLIDNKISTIITPNYDLTLDTILNFGFHEKIVRTREDYLQLQEDKTNGIYYKIHGTAEDKLEHTIIYTLRQEGNLEDWKIDLLKKIVEDKIILFIGYSGRDFDICPLIAEKMVYKKIYWLDYFKNLANSELIEEIAEKKYEELSAYAKHLLQSNEENVLILGDMVELLNLIFSTKVTVKQGNCTFDPKNLFRLTPIELLKWRFKIIDRLGYVRLGRELLERYKGQLDPIFYGQMKSAFYAHEGKYKQAAETSFQLFKSLEHSEKDKINSLIAASAIYIPYGKYCLSYKYLKKAKILIKHYSQQDVDEIKSQFIRIKFTFWMRMYQLTLKIPPLMLFKYFVKKRAKKLYTQAYQQLSSLGTWDDRQMLQHNAERLEIPTPVTNISLPAKVGFTNLGMPSMDIIRFRDSIRFGNPEECKKSLLMIQKYINRAADLGIKTEVWKLNRLKLIKGEKLNHSDKIECLEKWHTNLKTTEYISIFKNFYLLEFYIWKGILWINYHLKITNNRMKSIWS